ncbi:secreted RxLR effector protein 78-like [Spinacia oleracea]|uniref:Secreted RxLR effector protein 78-like n=1 Tax=Spinacia oleracea TaxID=3562 RepID=A0ABM3RH61_SPIOL|nr:secreted RxLR effector protein 78-like [Spinacia oleracea]
MAVIKVDMSKAYDRVDWIFLLKVLQAYRFSDKWVQLISQCISTVWFRTLVNGKAYAPFKPKCGLRQGDPLSPYLFLFCMDILSRMLSLAEDIKLFKDLQVSSRSPSISHLFFADDAMLFFKADKGACSFIMENLVRFGKISGQQLNLKKSFFKFSPL